MKKTMLNLIDLYSAQEIAGNYGFKWQTISWWSTKLTNWAVFGRR